MSKEMRGMVMMLLVLSVSFMFFVGCAKPPTQEMESAEKELTEAKAAAEEAAQTAGQALAAIEGNKAKMKQEATQMIEEAEKSLTEIKALTAAAIKKKLPINREELQGMIGKAEVDLVGVKNTLQEQKIRPAYDQVKAILAQLKGKIGEIATQLGLPAPGAAAAPGAAPAVPAAPAAKK